MNKETLSQMKHDVLILITKYGGSYLGSKLLGGLLEQIDVELKVAK